ncbi:MAG TPA: response regulator [Gammaproteobacteria bacterium]|nr:response regulator [Gammaproteobacteria bacterium]
MSDPATLTVHVVDDESAVRDALGLLLEAEGWPVATYVSADAFLRDCGPGSRGCVVLDLNMPGLNGLEAQDRLRERGIDMPVIILTGNADVPAAVRALKHGALDFIEKPFSERDMLGVVARALEEDRRRAAASRQRSDIARREAALTAREREIMELIVAGRANKVIAIDLGISERTVELHRSRIMKKMGARSVAELVQLNLQLQRRSESS